LHRFTAKFISWTSWLPFSMRSKYKQKRIHDKTQISDGPTAICYSSVNFWFTTLTRIKRQPVDFSYMSGGVCSRL
jgi:hypothetical protein